MPFGALEASQEQTNFAFGNINCWHGRFPSCLFCDGAPCCSTMIGEGNLVKQALMKDHPFQSRIL